MLVIATLNADPGLRGIELKSESAASEPAIVMRIRARYDDDEVISSRDGSAKCYNRDTGFHRTFISTTYSSTADSFPETTRTPLEYVRKSNCDYHEDWTAAVTMIDAVKTILVCANTKRKRGNEDHEKTREADRYT